MITVEVRRPVAGAGTEGTRTTRRRRESDYTSSEPFDRRVDGDQLRRLSERTRDDGGNTVAIPQVEFDALSRLAQGTCGIYAFVSPLDGAYIEVRSYVVRRYPWSKNRVGWQIAVMDSEKARARFAQAHMDDVRRGSW